MKHTAFFMISLSLILAITGCIKKQQNPVSDASDASISSNANMTEQDALDNVVVEYCKTGNCPCGDGFCSKGSYCIKDMCFCGANPDEGYFEENTIASNDYGEFECKTFEPDNYGCGEQEHVYHYFICNNDNGCKTADGRKYPKTPETIDMDYDLLYDLFVHHNFDDETEKIVPNPSGELICWKTSKYGETSEYDCGVYKEYESMIRERYLNKNCGPKLPADLEFMKREGAGTYAPCWSTPSGNDLACRLRQKCNDIGVTAEHISEYICDIGRYLHVECGSGAPFDYLYCDENPIGLRCHRTEGCTCGDTHCPNLALCKDGQCHYDLYYQHHTCPGDNWDSNEYDAVNYALQNNKCSLESYIEACKDEHDSEEDCANEFDSELCAEDLYWERYNSEMSLKDPCSSN